MVVAYLRVSTEKQFLANQREELLRFAEKNGLQIDKWYTETVSGSVRSKDRKLSGVLNRMQRGDSLIVTEISRLSRTMLEIMTILNSCIKKEIVLYSTKEGYVFQNDMNSKVLGFAFGLMEGITSEEFAVRRMENLQQYLRELPIEELEEHTLTCSMGAAFMPKDGTTFGELYKHADEALYTTKRNGRDGFRIYHEVEEKEV